MKRILLIFALLSFSVFSNLKAQDNAHATRNWHLLGDSILKDRKILMPKVFPKNYFSDQASACAYRFSRPDSTNTPRLYEEQCSRTVNDTSAVVTFRFIDIRESKPRRLLTLVTVRGNPKGLLKNAKCEIWFNEGFYNRTEPNKKFVHFVEKSCGDGSQLFLDFLEKLMPKPITNP